LRVGQGSGTLEWLSPLPESACYQQSFRNRMDLEVNGDNLSEQIGRKFVFHCG